MTTWTANDIPDLTGNVIIVTGANRGLGYEAACLMAQHNATVVLAVRSLANGENAADTIRQQVPNASLAVMHLDLADLATIHAFAETFKATYDRLDVLMNSAGIMAVPQGTTADEFELQFGVNHLGHFALTGLLCDVLMRTDNSRVVTVSSMAANNGTMQWDNLNAETEYSRFGAYGQSKLANLLFVVGLHKRLTASGVSTKSVAAHPGLSATDLQEGTEINIPILTPILFKSYKLFAMDTTQGSLSQVRAAVDPSVCSGDYYGPKRGIRGYPVRVDMPENVTDADADRLWRRSEELTGVTYPLSVSV